MGNRLANLTLNPENCILSIRNQKVIIDSDLAALYGTTTKHLNQQVKRNIDRFPSDFMFQLNDLEKQEVVTNCDHLSNLKFSHSNPFVFTEHGVIMVASLLNSVKAIEVSIYVVRTFIKLRKGFLTNKEVINKLFEIDERLGNHDESISNLILAIDKLINPVSEMKKQRIGFAPWADETES